MSRGQHETTDFRPSYVAASGAILVIVTIALSVLVWGFFNYFSKGTDLVEQITAGEDLPPAPRLEVDPHENLEQVRSREIQLLTTYGWTNRQDGVVRIPIDRAMDLMAERGLPDFGRPDSTKKESK